MRTKVNEISDEDFEQAKSSINTDISEKDKSLTEECTRFLRQISLHTYNFDFQEQQIEALKTVTKEDFIKHFEEVFFSKNIKRVDYQFNSHGHIEENAKFLESNKDSELYKDFERTHWDGVEGFKA